MADTPITPIFSSPVEPAPVTSSVSVWSRMANVIAAPGEAFDGIASLEKKLPLWLIPMILSIVITTTFSAVMMSNPAVQQKMRANMMERVQEQVASGKITQEQADKNIDMMMGVGKIIGMVGGLVAVPLMWLVIGLVFYLGLSFVLGAEVTFGNVFIVIALAGVIAMLEAIVTGFMQYATADLLMQPNLGALIRIADNDVLKTVLARINPFTFWWIFVLATGFAKISGVTSKKTLLLVGGAWIIWSAIIVVMSGIGIKMGF